jgi:hypothetical protein
VITESVSQDDDKQVAELEATNIQDTPIIEVTKAETAVEDVMLDLSDKITIHENALQRVEATSNITSEQENIPVQLDA